MAMTSSSRQTEGYIYSWQSSRDNTDERLEASRSHGPGLGAFARGGTSPARRDNFFEHQLSISEQRPVAYFLLLVPSVIRLQLSETSQGTLSLPSTATGPPSPCRQLCAPSSDPRPQHRYQARQQQQRRHTFACHAEALILSADQSGHTHSPSLSRSPMVAPS